MRLAALLLCCALPMAAQAPPELPRTVVSTDPPAPTSVITVPAGGDIQAALNRARGGQAIELACGATYTGAYTLPNRGTDTGWVTMRPSCHAALPASGSRMTPTIAAQLKIPKLLSDGSNLPVIQTAEGANHYRLVGLEITPGVASLTALVALGSDAQTNLAAVPRALILDRLYLHGRPDWQLRRSVALNSAHTAVVDSWLAENHERGSDSQAILGWTGPGPYLIRNNYMDASSEVLMFGGGDPRIPGLVPSDIQVLGNHLTRPLSWAGTWAVKNLFELKNARRVLVEGNVMENNWMSGQDGSAIVLKSTNQDGSCTWCETSHVTMRRNIIRNVGGAFNLAARPEGHPAISMHDIWIEGNLIVGVRTATAPGPGWLFVLQQALVNVTLTRNTAYNASTPLSALVFLPFGTPVMTGVSFTKNLVVAPAGANYGIFGDNTGPGRDAIAMYAPTAVVTGNVFAGLMDSRYPPGNVLLGEPAAVGFSDAAAGNFSISASSPAAGAGADLTALMAATADAVSGDASSPPSPTPVPSISTAQLRAAIAALERSTGTAGRENTATKAALRPVLDYLRALQEAMP
jgi:hypothetical protein